MAQHSIALLFIQQEIINHSKNLTTNIPFIMVADNSTIVYCFVLTRIISYKSRKGTTKICNSFFKWRKTVTVENLFFTIDFIFSMSFY